MEKKERVLNRCRNCGHRPGLSTIPPWTVAECGICKQIQSAANYPELVKRWNEANPKGEPENGAKPEPIWTALEGEPEFNLAPESEPVLPKNSAANPCKCGGNVIYFQTFDEEHWFICSKCGQKLSSKISYTDLVAKWNELNPTRPVEITLSKAFSPIKEIRLTARIDDLDLETEPEDEPEPETDNAPESEPVLPVEDKPFQCSCGGHPIDVSRRGRIVWICNKCGQTLVDKPNNSKLTEEDVDQIFDGHYTSELESEPVLPPGWSHATAFSTEGEIHVLKHGGPDPEPGSRTESETKDETDPLSYQVGGSHYSRYEYQPITFFNDMKLDFNRANAIKYLTRWKEKNGIEDLKKAVQYLRFAEQEREKQIDFELRFLDQFDKTLEGRIIEEILDMCLSDAREELEELIDASEANAAAQEDESET